MPEKPEKLAAMKSELTGLKKEVTIQLNKLPLEVQHKLVTHLLCVLKAWKEYGTVVDRHEKERTAEHDLLMERNRVYNATRQGDVEAQAKLKELQEKLETVRKKLSDHVPQRIEAGGKIRRALDQFQRTYSR